MAYQKGYGHGHVRLGLNTRMQNAHPWLARKAHAQWDAHASHLLQPRHQPRHPKAHTKAHSQLSLSSIHMSSLPRTKNAPSSSERAKVPFSDGKSAFERSITVEYTLTHSSHTLTQTLTHTRMMTDRRTHRKRNELTWSKNTSFF